MRILFINTVDIRGGASKVAYSLKERLKLQGNVVSFFVKHKYSEDNDVHIAKWPSPLSLIIKKITGKDLGSVLSSFLHRLLATDIDWFKTDAILKDEAFKEADIVHCHNLHGNYFKLDTLRKMSLRKAVVWTFHDMWPITSHCGHAYDGKLSDGFYECPNLNAYQDLLWNNEKHLIRSKRTVYNRARFHIVAPCRWIMEKIENSVLRAHPVSLIYNGIDENIFYPHDKLESRKLLALPLDKKIIVFVTANGASEEKGGAYLDTVSKRFSKNEDILFLCIGGTSNENPERSNIVYIPYVSDATILARYYSAGDMFLFASLAETFPLVILESLSSGLPVVSFDVGGVKEAVTHKEQGYIAEYKNVDDLARGINHILSLDKSEYALMRTRARDRVVANFTLDRMAKNYLELYKKLTE